MGKLVERWAAITLQRVDCCPTFVNFRLLLLRAGQIVKRLFASKACAPELLQFRVFRFGLLQDRNARVGYEWTGTHDPGYVTDPRTNNRLFGDVTITPAHWLTFGNDASMVLQKSFPVVQRTNHLYVDSIFVTIKPVPKWSIGAGYTYLQDNLRTDMTFLNDPAVAVYTQPLVPYKQLSQTFSIHSTYELKNRLGLNVSFAHSAAHSSMRPDVNPADYPPFPWTTDPSGDPQFPAHFANALAIGAGPVSQMNVPQTLIGATGEYHLRSGFDGGLRFNYGSYTDNIRPDLTGKLQSYSVFFGRVW